MIEENQTPRLHVDTTKQWMETKLNWMFIAGELRGLLKGKNCKRADMVFPFPAGFIYRCSGWMEEAPLTKVHMPCSELMPSITTDNSQKGCSYRKLMKLNYCINQIKRSLVRAFSDHCDFGLHGLKIHLPDHVVETFQAFGTLSVLEAWPIDQYSLNIKHA